MDPNNEAPATQTEGGTPAPDEGAGAQTEYSGPFAAALQAVPNGADAVQAALQDIERKTSQRFQEHADFRKAWEPYEPMREAFGQYQPNEVEQLLAFGQMMLDPGKATDIVSDPDAFREMWQAWGDALGYGEQSGEPVETAGEQPGVDGEIATKLNELMEWKQQQEQQFAQQTQERQQQEADQAFEQAMQSLASEHPDLFKRGDDDQPTPVERAVAGQAAMLISAGQPIGEAVKAGFELVQQIRGQGQTALVTEKLKQPEPAVKRGGADTQPPKVKSWEDVEARVDQRMGVA